MIYALAATLASLALFVFCVLASAEGFHSHVTGPGAGVSAVLLAASAIWLNRRAGGEPGE